MYRIHYNCLNYFKDVFDEAIICISLDDVNNTDDIKYVEHTICEMGYKGKLTFKIVPNTSIREAKTFYDEITSTLGEFEGWTFFAHTKGLSNLAHSKQDSIVDWVIQSYYLGLGEIESFEKQIAINPLLSYGYPLCKYNPILTQQYVAYRWFYAGAMFWMNDVGIKHFTDLNHIRITAPYNRWYAEEFLCQIYPVDSEEHVNAGSYGYFYYGDRDWYADSSNLIEDTFTENTPELVERYHYFRNSVLE